MNSDLYVLSFSHSNIGNSGFVIFCFCQLAHDAFLSFLLLPFFWWWCWDYPDFIFDIPNDSMVSAYHKEHIKEEDAHVTPKLSRKAGQGRDNSVIEKSISAFSPKGKGTRHRNSSSKRKGSFSS